MKRMKTGPGLALINLIYHPYQFESYGYPRGLPPQGAEGERRIDWQLVRSWD